MTPYEMRTPCGKCGNRYGTITTKHLQDVVNCAVCGTYAYCAPRVETGRAQRTLRTRPDIAPSRRWRILETHDHKCVGCGASGDLQLDHLISRSDADAHGFLDSIIDSDDNLAPMCPECNSGKRPTGSASIRLMYRLLTIKAKAAGQ
jgi:5-methylcytosine-specific restriction endonuclease McrA